MRTAPAIVAVGIAAAFLIAACGGRTDLGPASERDTGVDTDAIGGDTGAEICGNGLDDDDDGAVDCADADCAGSPACLGECPAVDIGDALGRAVMVGETFGESAWMGTCGGGSAPEVAIGWTAPFDGLFRLDTDGSDFDTVLYVRDAICTGDESACNDDDGAGVQSELFIEAAAGQRYIVFVDGFGSERGFFQLNIGDASAPVEICDDGFDNDGDGLVDCDDFDCARSPLCGGPEFEFDCGNFRDDDFDGLVDCEDPDCFGFPECPLSEFDCANGIDDDDDGRIDCEDPDCEFRPECRGPEFEFDCANGVDDDFDGLIDCDDFDCFGFPECVGAEICTDGVDNDLDGRVDCDDFDCFDHPACREPRREICFNGVDDDFDGRIDCDDPDCFDFPECEVGSCPEGDLGEALGEGVLVGSLFGAGADIEAGCAPTGGPDLAVLWRAPFDGAFEFDTFGSDFDTVLSLRIEDCNGPELACNDDDFDVQSRITVDLPAGMPVVVAIDGFNGDVGRFVLNIREVGTSVEICGDGVDNDRDGRVDCADPDCAFSPECVDAEICFNRLDDDFDGLIDCDDPDCFGFPECEFREEICFNGIDDDRNGLIDCDDPACFGLPDCGFFPEDCANGFDDDRDGRIDCDDPDCFDFPECFGIEICDNFRDDDFDGLVDCEDPECIESGFCSFECPQVSIGSRIGRGIWRGTTTGGSNVDGASCGGRNAPEATIAWVAPETGVYFADTAGSAYDTLLYVRGGSCGGAELACNDDVDGDTTSRVFFDARRGQTYVFFVDGYGTSNGNYVLSILPAEPADELICDDFVDNDGDGLFDCEDPDCEGADVCSGREICFNGLDDDRDGRIDCDDPDCFGDEACVTREICDNDRDDDRDGRVDCDDPDCRFFPGCEVVEICDNRRDDDGDGAVDCRDSDCFFHPACVAEEICFNGFDDDGDGAVDCEDPDCFGDPDCFEPRPEICTNGIDDDLDGRADCADVDCFTDPACFDSEDCTNGRDDDGDGLVDCADPTCFFNDACARGEICDNGVDDDGDGVIDCDDPECLIEPVCTDTEDCSNGVDDDGDGAVDCDDLTCILDPVCRTDEDCTNGVDDDGDGRTDCDDTECADHPACDADECPDTSIGSRVGNGVARGSTAGAGGELFASCAPSDAEEVAFAWNAPASGIYTFDTAGSEFPTVLYLLDGACDAREIACAVGFDDGGAASITLEVVRGQELVIVVDGFADFAGRFVLNINRATSEAGRCTDGVDNDRDGAIDCDDPDCEGDDACTPRFELCFNGVDDDFDDLVDCEDPDCFDDPFCSFEEICTNRVDDDGDGRVDCADPDCFGHPACLPGEEVCGNGIDDDDDGRIDCDDPDCEGDPTCDRPELCANGVDDDGDGRIDCDDPDCFDDRRCLVEEICDNGVDDDRDRLIDCADSECVDHPACVFECPDLDIGAAEGEAVWRGSTVGTGNQTAGACSGGGGEEIALSWTAPRSGRWVFDTYGSRFDTQLYIRTDCAGEELACNDDAEGTQSEVEVALAGGTTVIIFIDGWSASSAGVAQLNIRREITSEDGLCTNGLDDDRDGDVDCGDRDCLTDPACVPDEICDDGRDNDFDGNTDCDDPDCEGVEVCLGPEICGNGRDDDGDGRTDCNDPDCLPSAECFGEEDCGNGRDDDGDGLVDCADPSCSISVECFTSENCGNGRDDDGDGLVDCEDPSCTFLPECAGGGSEICDNFRDDDGDGAVDCDDSDCFLSFECLPIPFP